jgi:para-nitrobenzyl esterase
VRSLRVIACALVVACSSSATPDAGPAPPAAAPPPSDPLVVATDSGSVHGTRDHETLVWKGIPYAAPPIGDLRFRAPGPAIPWDGIRDASEYGAECVQLEPGRRTASGSEDCLTLNVWSPIGDPLLPVIFWIHGGDDVIGSSREPFYDGRLLAEKAHAVVVTINYRLGALGFLAHPAFALENEHHATGDYGIQDQIAALEWTQRNIARFGGDGARVTIAGQSAGASDSCALLASPRARGLFAGAMMMSLSCYVVAPDLVGSTNDAAERALGCAGADAAACFRAARAADLALLPGASLRETAEQANYYTTVDGWIVPEAPETTLARGAHAHVPMIVGSTKDEYSQLLDLVLVVPEPDAYPAKIEELVGKPLAPEVLALYPLDRYGTPRAALTALVSDQVMTCPSRRAARSASRTQTEPVYRYVFAQVPPGDAARWGAPHGIDVGHLFQTFTPGGAPPSADEQALADRMALAVGRFVASGTIDGWPAYDATDPHTILDTAITTGAGWRGRECDFWDRNP